MNKIIIYSKTYGTKEVLIDDKYHDFLNRFMWHLEESGNNFYAVTNFGPMNKRFSLRIHNLLFPNTKIVDHKNSNGLDNRENNLRPTNQNLNNKNKLKRLISTSLYKGVVKKGKMWYSSIGVNNKRIFLGSFSNELAAATCYNIYSRLYHGEFSRTNDIKELINWEDFKQKNSSKYKYVSWDKTRNNWALNIKQKIRKRFNSEEEAYEAYLKWSKNGVL